ncbi:hypothetical protein [Lentibacillus salicampi]|uniref:Uncharacterized protein n=1 Tax=Lentibacillus salicampi TaxID=175306 RepID=A0A4Y9AA25_9BACI|nr:hypothetical protein [Lentibacillus salicampi]TFJ92315.1 hypothetical protein E4U82_13245 [Lentibacillus salicampi]
MECYEQAIQRYYSVLTSYLALAKRLETCCQEDTEFYQHVCLLFANKIKEMQAELADSGFVLCQRSNISVPCEETFAAVEKEK